MIHDRYYKHLQEQARREAQRESSNQPLARRAADKGRRLAWDTFLDVVQCAPNEEDIAIFLEDEAGGSHLIELLETGSVTITRGEQQYTIALTVEVV